MEAEKEIETNSDSCSLNEISDKDQPLLQPVNPEQPTLSKRQLKLLEKRKRWLELKPLRRAKEKEKRKLKMKSAKESGITLRLSRRKLKASKMSASSCKVKVCFDLSLCPLMTPSELSKTFKQLHRCYSINRRAPAPLQLYINGYNEVTKGEMNRMSGCFNWDVHFDERIYLELFDPSDIIYLTSDSPNVLESFDDTKVYIIGALVDHNRLKNTCYEKALKEGVHHARLPLDKYFKFKCRTVLTIDQVYSIILEITEGKTWIEAVTNVVPKRKEIELRYNDSNNENSVLDTDINENNNAHSTGTSFAYQNINEDVPKKCDSTLNKDYDSNSSPDINNTLDNRASIKDQ